MPAVAVPRLSINLLPAPLSGQLAGDRRLETIARRHSMFLTPAGADASWRKGARSRHVNVYFGADALADAVPTEIWATPRCNVHVPGASGLVDLLERELRQDLAFAPEAVDSLARLLLVALARRGGSEGPRTLTPAALRRVREFVDARLRHRIGVADLARVAGLPPSTFARAFMRQVGEPPYRYVIRCRVRAALALLAANRVSNEAIAAACGFANPQHLATVLRRELDVTPSEARRAARGTSRGPD